MRTDIRLNYAELQAVRQRISDYYNALDTLEERFRSLKSFLQEQESEAVRKLLEKSEDVIIDIAGKKETAQQLERVVSDYIEDMRGLIREVTAGRSTRVDTWDVRYNLWQIQSSISELDRLTGISVGSSVCNTLFMEEAEAKAKQEKMKRNYQKLESFRSGTIRGLVSRMQSRYQEMEYIYKNYLVAFENMDDAYRKKLDSIYRECTSAKEQQANAWKFFRKVSGAFLEAFAVAFVLAFTVTMLPAMAVAGVAVVLVAGCVIMANTPQEYVPEWLNGAKETADEMGSLAKQTLEEGPLVLVEAVGQGLMDQVQTPAGIATVSGAAIGTVAGGWAGVEVKGGWGNYNIDEILETDVESIHQMDVKTAFENDIGKVVEKTNMIEYKPPKGGGGITDIIEVNSEKITFGHGGRHLTGTGLGVRQVNQILAEEVSKVSIEVGEDYVSQVVIEGVEIEYRAYRISDTVVKVGTYYVKE